MDNEHTAPNLGVIPDKDERDRAYAIRMLRHTIIVTLRQNRKLCKKAGYTPEELAAYLDDPSSMQGFEGLRRNHEWSCKDGYPDDEEMEDMLWKHQNNIAWSDKAGDEK